MIKENSKKKGKPMEAKRTISDRQKLQYAIGPFAERYGGNENSANEMASYITAKLPSSIFTQGQWYFYDDSIVYTYEAGGHSFFDDGGGVEYLTLWKFTHTDPVANKDDVIENKKLEDTHAYPIFEGLNETFLCKDPFGLSGVFEIQFCSKREWTD